jgi:hypothetical protein
MDPHIMVLTCSVYTDELEQKLSVMFWNINNLGCGTHRNERVLCQVICDQAPDIVCILEWKPNPELLSHRDRWGDPQYIESLRANHYDGSSKWLVEAWDKGFTCNCTDFSPAKATNKKRESVLMMYQKGDPRKLRPTLKLAQARRVWTGRAPVLVELHGFHQLQLAAVHLDPKNPLERANTCKWLMSIPSETGARRGPSLVRNNIVCICVFSY